MNKLRRFLNIKIVILAVTLMGGMLIVALLSSSKTGPTNFAECVKAGNPVLETFPEQCKAGSKTFVNPNQSSVAN